MQRRQVLRVGATAATFGVAGCLDDAAPAGSQGATPEESPSDSPAGTLTSTGPGSPYDFLLLAAMPDYVTRYDDTVVVRYDELDAAAQRAVQQALDSDEGYRESTADTEQTDVMALFSHIEERWQEAHGESFGHTYLEYEGDHYGIKLVQEGDFVRVDSIPCREDACPATPTPPRTKTS